MRQALDCERWHTLPRWPTNLDNQEAGVILRMDVCLTVYEAFAALAGQSNMAEFGNANPGIARIVSMVRALELETTETP